MHQNLESVLAQVYGDRAAEQVTRYEAALTAYAQCFGDADGVDIFRAPGRVNLIGEHTDYNHGFVLPAALDKDILLLARQRHDRQLRLRNVATEYGPIEFAIAQSIPIGPPGDWGNYARGTAQTLVRVLGQEADTAVPGLDGLIVGTPPYGVPQGSGLSSSSALTVVLAVALAHYAGWQPRIGEMVQLCSDAEWYVGTRGGIMDQYVSLQAQRDHALFLDCRPDGGGVYTTRQLPLPQTHQLVIVDSGVHHHNVRGEFNLRVAACRAGVGLLRAAHPDITHLRDVQEQDWNRLAALLPNRARVDDLQAQGVTLDNIPGLTPETELRVRACCRHVWTENGRVLAALEAMRANDVARLGALMNQAHTSARDDYVISCPEVEILIEAAHEVDGVAGARPTGAGWGGCIIALVENEAVNDFQRHVENVYRRKTGRTPGIFACHSAPGAGCLVEGF